MFDFVVQIEAGAAIKNKHHTPIYDVTRELSLPTGDVSKILVWV